jgi:hypothetical protein
MNTSPTPHGFHPRLFCTLKNLPWVVCTPFSNDHPPFSPKQLQSHTHSAHSISAFLNSITYDCHAATSGDQFSSSSCSINQQYWNNGSLPSPLKWLLWAPSTLHLLSSSSKSGTPSQMWVLKAYLSSSSPAIVSPLITFQSSLHQHLPTPYIQPKLFTSTGNWYHRGPLMMSLGYLINMPQINTLIFPLLRIFPSLSPGKMCSNLSPSQ